MTYYPVSGFSVALSQRSLEDLRGSSRSDSHSNYVGWHGVVPERIAHANISVGELCDIAMSRRNKEYASSKFDHINPIAHGLHRTHNNLLYYTDYHYANS